MVKAGYKKISFDINEDLLLEIDLMGNGKPRAYRLNRIIEKYFKITRDYSILLDMISEGTLEAKSDIEPEELKWLMSL